MNRQELRLAVQERIRDTDGIRTTADEVNRYLDDGYADIAERTGAVVRTATINVPAGEHFALVPDNCLYPIVMREAAEGLPVDFVDWPFIDKHDKHFIRRVSSFPRIAAMWGLREMLIYEAFASAGQLELMYAAIPDAMTDVDEPELAEQHHQALIHYCHMRVLLKEAHDDMAAKRVGRAKAQRKQYLALSGAIEKWSMDRHGTMRLAIYGEALRKHDLTSFPELQGSWRGPML